MAKWQSQPKIWIRKTTHFKWEPKFFVFVITTKKKRTQDLFFRVPDLDTNMQALRLPQFYFRSTQAAIIFSHILCSFFLCLFLCVRDCRFVVSLSFSFEFFLFFFALLVCFGKTINIHSIHHLALIHSYSFNFWHFDYTLLPNHWCTVSMVILLIWTKFFENNEKDETVFKSIILMKNEQLSKFSSCFFSSLLNEMGKGRILPQCEFVTHYLCDIVSNLCKIILIILTMRGQKLSE